MEQPYNDITKRLIKQTNRLGWLIILVCIVTIWLLMGAPGTDYKQKTIASAPQIEEEDFPLDSSMIGQIDSESGMIIDTHWELTKVTCNQCHSPKLFTQTRATREGWKEMFIWMQETQGLWDLGESEPKILDYLSKHYGYSNPQTLQVDEWYELD